MLAIRDLLISFGPLRTAIGIAELLDKLVAGEKILFAVEQQQGAFVVTGVEKTGTQAAKP